MSFNKVLDKYRKISFSERDKGDRFERLMKAYLLTDPKYSNKFKKVWLFRITRSILYTSSSFSNYSNLLTSCNP